MDNCKESTTMVTLCYMDVDEQGQPLEQPKYKGTIESFFLYLTISCPNILHCGVLDFNMHLRNLI